MRLEHAKKTVVKAQGYILFTTRLGESVYASK